MLINDNIKLLQELDQSIQIDFTNNKNQLFFSRNKTRKKKLHPPYPKIDPKNPHRSQFTDNQDFDRDKIAKNPSLFMNSTRS